MWSTPGFWNRFLWCRNIMFLSLTQKPNHIQLQVYTDFLFNMSQIGSHEIKSSTHSVVQSFFVEALSTWQSLCQFTSLPFFCGGSCFPISVGSIYKWQDQFWRSQVWMLFFFLPPSISADGLWTYLWHLALYLLVPWWSNSFFLFGCVCVKELVFLELSYYEGDKELTKKNMYFPTKSQMVCWICFCNWMGWTCWNRNNLE